MADQSSAQERTEQATPHRRRKAHEEGQVPRSMDLSAAVVLLSGAAGISLFGADALSAFTTGTLRESFSRLAGGPMTEPEAALLLRDFFGRLVLAILPILGAVAGPTLLVNALQGRGVWSGKPIEPKFSHINPLEGIKRLFSLQSLFNLLKGFVKLAVVGTAVWVVFSGIWGELLGLSGVTLPDLLSVLDSAVFKLAVVSGIAFLAVAGADYGFAVFQHEKKLRMTRQEIVQERKEQDGDPLVKGRILSTARALARKRMLGAVAQADVVVTNPTHLAVALKYDPAVSAAPIVLAMGERKLAERIKLLAAKHGVPMVENRPLARALVSTAKVGKAIPPALYAAVAEVLAFVYRQRGRLPNLAAGRTR